MSERTTDERYQDSLTAYDFAVRAYAEAIISGDPTRIRTCAVAQISAVIERERALINRITHIVVNSQLIVEDLRDEMKIFKTELEMLILGLSARVDVLESGKDTPAGLRSEMVGDGP